MGFKVGQHTINESKINPDDAIFVFLVGDNFNNRQELIESDEDQAIASQTAVNIDTPILFVLKKTEERFNRFIKEGEDHLKKSYLIIRSKNEFLSTPLVFSYDHAAILDELFFIQGSYSKSNPIHLLINNLFGLDWVHKIKRSQSDMRVASSPSSSTPSTPERARKTFSRPGFSATPSPTDSAKNAASIELDKSRNNDANSDDEKLPSTSGKPRMNFSRVTSGNSSVARALLSARSTSEKPNLSISTVAQGPAHADSLSSLRDARRLESGNSGSNSDDESYTNIHVDTSDRQANVPDKLNTDFLRFTATNSILENKKNYLRNLFNWFDPSKKNNVHRAKEAGDFIVWLFDKNNNHLLKRERYHFSESYSLTTHSAIQVLRFLESCYPELTVDPRIIGLKKASPEIEEHKYYRKTEAIVVNDKPVSLSQYMRTIQVPVANSTQIVTLSWRFSTKNNKKQVIHKNHAEEFLRDKDFSYLELNTLFKFYCGKDDKKIYVDRAIDYFNFSNHPSDENVQERVKREAEFFVKGLIADQTNFCRQARTSGVHFFSGVSEGDSRSYCELLRFFADNYGVGSNFNQTTGLTQELDRVAKKSKGYFYTYWKQVQGTSYVPSAKNIVVEAQNIGTNKASIKISKKMPGCFG